QKNTAGRILCSSVFFCGHRRCGIIPPMRRAARVSVLCLSVVMALATLAARDGLRAQAPAAPAVQAALSGADLVRATYTKYEYMVPMRDGARLFTAVYVPKDASQKYPFLITRTPYSVSPYGVDQ